MTVGKRIKDYRIAAGLTQTELAESVQISKQTLYKYENDIITNIPSDKIELIAKRINATPALLMGWQGDPAASLTPSDAKKVKLDKLYYSLNDEGKDRLIEQGEMLASMDKYKLSESHEEIG